MNSLCNICGEKVKFFFTKKKQPEIIYPIQKKFKKNLKKFHKSNLVVGKCNKCDYLQTINKLSNKKIIHMYKTEQSFSTSLIENPDLLGDIETDAYEYIKKFLIIKKLNNISVCEVGGFDGWLIKKLNKFFKNKLLIEPNLRGCNIAKKNKIDTINGFFDEELANKKNGNFDLVITRHVIEHVPDLKNFVLNLSKIMKENGYLIVETPCLDKILELGKTRVFIHQHLHYFSKYALEKVFSGFKLVNKQVIDESVMIMIFKKEITFKKIKRDINFKNKLNFFKKNIEKKKQKLKRVVDQNKNDILIFGASSQINDLVTLFGLNENKITCIIDSNNEKKNYFLPSVPNLKIKTFKEYNFKYNELVIIATASKKRVIKILDKSKHSGRRFLF